MIIGFTGKKGSGKNTAASMVNYIMNNLTFEDWKSKWNKKELKSVSRLRQYKDVQKPSDPCELLIKQLNEYVELEYLKIFYEEKSFASKVKGICSILTGIPRADWDNRELRDVELDIKGLENPQVLCYVNNPLVKGDKFYVHQYINNYTYRTFMQRIGTEAMRDAIHQDIWVNALMKDYLPINPELARTDLMSIDYSDCTWPNWTITDVRFDNEAKAIKDKGGIIVQINRELNNKDTHASEQPIHDSYVDIVIDNSTDLEDLYDSLEFFLTYPKMT